MKNSTFLICCLLIFSGLVSAHALVRERLSPAVFLEARLAHVQKEKQEAELRALLASHQLADYQQHIATLLPEAVKNKSFEVSYPLRQLASVVGADSSRLEIERASGVFEQAKSMFREKLYEDSNQRFADLIDRYPESVHVVEAHFLLAEGRFQLREFEEAITTVETMIDLFPESELTGFALLRLGRIFEIQDRLEDAIDIYRSVQANFKHPDLQEQARRSLKAVSL